LTEGAYRISRRSWLLAGLALPVSRAFAPVTLSVTWDGDSLHVAAPQLHFLTGKPLERLKDGAAVMFLSQLTVSIDENRTIFRRLPERFVISYDLWEEKFSVTRLGGMAHTASHLTAGAAEAWCVESMVVSASGIDPTRPLWLRLELRAADPREEAAVIGDLGISITRLIEVFGRRPRFEQPHWTLDAGPLKLSELKRTEIRGA
jgi:hypothetical protein